MFVLDTNTVIDYFRGRGKVAERLFAVKPQDIGRISAPKVANWHD